MFDGPKWTQEVEARLYAGDFEGAAFLVHQNLNTIPANERNRVRRMRELYNSVKDAHHSFDGPKWTKKVKALLFSGDLESASAQVHQDLIRFPVGERNRVRQMRQLYDSVKNAYARPVPEGYEVVSLKNDSRVAVRISDIPDDIRSASFGYYRAGGKYPIPSSFKSDFRGIDAAFVSLLKAARFSTGQETGHYFDFRVVENAYICGVDIMTHAYAFDDDIYVAEDSARVAKSSPRAFRLPPTAEIEEALLLPIPHHAGNYYHVMAEMAYGLRMANAEERFPIVYQEDRFGILPEICKRLGIDQGRLLSFEKARGVIFKKAILPSNPMYYWSKTEFDFFRSLVGDELSPKDKIYLSRRRSSRGPENEVDVEQTLQAEGYKIIFAEDLDFADQVDTFAKARMLVSSHGAGLTNTGFMSRGSGLVEMFPSNMLTRDFYMRTRHNDMPYLCLAYEKNVDIGLLLKRMERVERLVDKALPM